MNTDVQAQDVKVGVPEGYMRNPIGHLVPVDSISPLDLLRNEQVEKIMARVEALRAHMRLEKQAIYELMGSYVSLAEQEYDVKTGGKKGNMTLPSFDGDKKVVVAVSESMAFDERLNFAQQLVTECLREWTDGGKAELKAVVEEAFSTDKTGRISTWQIMRLLRIESDNPKWKQAMVVIRESMYADSKKEYIRFYHRKSPNDKHQMISLDFSSMPV